MELSKGRPQKMSHDGTFATLDDIGLNRNQPSRWQKIANVPKAEFTKHIEET